MLQPSNGKKDASLTQHNANYYSNGNIERHTGTVFGPSPASANMAWAWGALDKRCVEIVEICHVYGKWLGDSLIDLPSLIHHFIGAHLHTGSGG